MKTFEDFKVLTVEQITELGYDKIRECQTDIRKILNEKATEINDCAKELFSEIIDKGLEVEISVALLAYHAFTIRILETRYEVKIGVSIDEFVGKPEITVSVSPNIDSFSLMTPDENMRKIIKLYYALIFTEGIYDRILDFVLKCRAELDEVKDVYRRYKSVADSINSKEENARRIAENEKLQKEYLDAVRHERPRFVRVVIKNSPDMNFIYRRQYCDIAPNHHGVFMSPVKSKYDEYTYEGRKIRWVVADLLRDKDGKYVMSQ